MGGTSRFMALLTPPFPVLRPSLVLLHRRLSSLPASPLRLLNLASPSKSRGRTCQIVKSYHSRPSNNSFALNSAAAAAAVEKHPWPEWTHFLRNLLNWQGFAAPQDYRVSPEDAFVVYEELPEDFVRASASCLAFSRARPDLLGLLSRRDIEAVVSNGTPFLFKSALDTARRMRAFLGTDGINGAEFGAASTVDLMKYILSYASNPTLSSEGNGLYSREVIDSSVRNLLRELDTVSSGVSGGNVPASSQQFSGRDVQALRPFGQNVQMKRGDWICTKCNFMNFARNMKCLECEESRPRRLLSAGEWECPQCSFFNYGRNTICLRCDCRKPGAPLVNNSNSQSGTGFNGDYSYKNHPSGSPLTGDTYGRSSSISSPHYSGITSEQNGGNGFSRPPFQTVPSDFQYGGSSYSSSGSDTFSSQEQQEVSFQEPASSGVMIQNIGENFCFGKDSVSQMDSQNQENEQAEKSERWFKKIAELHNVKDLPSAVSDEDFPEIMPMRKGESRFVVSQKKDRSLTSPKYKRQVGMDQANNAKFVPFVPFPPGYFTRKDTDQSTVQDSNTASISENPSNTMMLDTQKSEYSNHGVADTFTVPRLETMRPDNSGTSNANIGHTSEAFSVGNQPDGSSLQGSITYQTTSSSSWPNGNSARASESTAASGGASIQAPQSDNLRKSFEGSAVKETDPLDMSEEAKAERWFKRVAQIKDISELSQIPDEDFPSIMPMRKGVNRFVVSKRKTPLERRLTSQQHRRNLPVITNDSWKRENDSS